jgi:hypothetical protein
MQLLPQKSSVFVLDSNDMTATKAPHFAFDYTPITSGTIDLGILKMEAVCLSETLVSTYTITMCCYPEDHIRQLHRQESFKCHILEPE